MMEDYAVFTLNTSRIGENLVQEFDNKIQSFNTSGILAKRSEPEPLPVVLAARATITTAPLPTITLAPRDLDDLVDGLTSKVGEVKSEIGGKASSIASAVESKATSAAGAVESAVASKVQSAIEAVKTALVREVNEAYLDFVDEMDLKGFYAVHMMTTCEGEYVYPNGTNYTISLTAPEPKNGTLDGKVFTCENHSMLNPLTLVKVLYWIGIVFTGLALAIGIWGAARYSRKLAILNVLATLPGVMFIALASAATHAFAAGAAGLVNFVGNGIGISGQSGGKFVALTWATTVLLLVNMCLWSLLAVLGERVQFPRRRNGGGEVGEKVPLPPSYGGYAEEQHEMRIRHPHFPGAGAA